MSHKDDGERETTSDLRPSSASADDQLPKQKTGDDANLKAIASDGENQLHHTDHHLHIGPELVVHVAAFASIANSDVLNICLAVGPIPSHAIRKTYLQNNAHYLENSLRCLLQTPMGEANTKKCRDDYRAWMAVNSDWKGRCTNEMIECLQRREEVDASGTRDANSPPTARSFGSIHPYDPFNSPAIAIELGLNEILRFHVEARNVDINAHFPSLFGVEQRHLLAVAMDGNNVEAFRFLTSHDNADMMRRANADTSLFQYAWAAAKKINYVDCFIINTLIEHQSFDANAILPGNGHGNNLRPLQKCLHELEDLMEGNTTTGNLNSAPFLFALSIPNAPGKGERSRFPRARRHSSTPNGVRFVYGRETPWSCQTTVQPPRRKTNLGNKMIAVAMDEESVESFRCLHSREDVDVQRAAVVYTIVWHRVVALLQNPTDGLQRWNDLNRDTEAFFFC